MQERRTSVGCPQIIAANDAEPSNKNKKFRLVWKTVRSIFFNPILFMTVLGVAGGVAFPNGLPEIISGMLRVSNFSI